MSFAPKGVSPFLPGKNYLNVDNGIKEDVDRSVILRKKNNKVNYKKCSDEELLDLLEKNEKLLSNKALINNLPDKGEKILLKNKEIKEEITRRNITIEKEKDNNDEKMDIKEVNNNSNSKEKLTETENKSMDTTETTIEKDMEVESLNQKLKSINISEGSDEKDTNKPTPKYKRGQARVAEMILNNPNLYEPKFMIPHKPNKNHTKFISIEESLEIQIRQRKLQKEIEINEAIKRLEKTKMSTGPINYHSNKYRNTHSDYEDDDDDDDDDDSEDDNRSYYSEDEEADEFLFGRHN
jgi:hypothetical protein